MCARVHSISLRSVLVVVVGLVVVVDDVVTGVVAAKLYGADRGRRSVPLSSKISMNLRLERTSACGSSFDPAGRQSFPIVRRPRTPATATTSDRS